MRTPLLSGLLVFTLGFSPVNSYERTLNSAVIMSMQYVMHDGILFGPEPTTEAWKMFSASEAFRVVLDSYKAMKAQNAGGEVQPSDRGANKTVAELAQRRNRSSPERNRPLVAD